MQTLGPALRIWRRLLDAKKDMVWGGCRWVFSAELCGRAGDDHDVYSDDMCLNVITPGSQK